MSSLGKMELQVQADISNLQQQLNKAGVSTKAFADKSTRALSELTTTGTKVNNSFSNVAKGSNQASGTLLNLGSVAQDAQHGLSGVTSSIGPLAESFQNLRIQTGSTKSAIASLVNGLKGGGGLGIAISVAAGLLTTLAQKYFNEASIKAQEMAEKVNVAKEALKGIFSNAGKEATEVVSLITVLKSEIETRERKLAAIKELQKINPEIFNQLKLEGNAVAGLDIAYQSYIANLKKVIQAKIIQAKIEQQITELLKLQGVEQSSFAKNIIKSQRELANKNPNTALAINLTQQLNKIEADTRKKTGAIELIIEDFTRQLSEVTGGIKLDILPDDAAGKVKKNATTISDVIAELGREIDFLNAKGIIFGTNEADSKIKAITSAIERLVKDFKVSPTDTIISKLIGLEQTDFFTNRGLEGITRNIQDLQRVVKQELKKTEIKEPVTITVPILPKIDMSKEPLKAFLKDVTDEVQSSFTSLANNIGVSFGEMLGKAISGGAGIGDFFKGIFSQLGAAMKELGKFFIQTGIQIKLIKQFLIKNPALAIAGGIALIALGSLIQAKTNVPGFADGVQNFGGGYAMVGERGRELVRLPAGSDVIPNHSLNSIGSDGGFIATGLIRGQDILLAIERASKTKGRNG